MSENSTPQEAWNMATATLKRLSWLLDQSSIAAQTGNLGRWCDILMDLRRNLSPFMERKTYNIVMEKFNSLPNKWRLPNGRYSEYQKVNKILDEIFIIFITLMKKNGLLMPKAIDSGKSIIEM